MKKLILGLTLLGSLPTMASVTSDAVTASEFYREVQVEGQAVQVTQGVFFEGKSSQILGISKDLNLMNLKYLDIDTGDHVRVNDVPVEEVTLVPPKPSLLAHCKSGVEGTERYSNVDIFRTAWGSVYWESDNSTGNINGVYDYADNPKKTERRNSVKIDTTAGALFGGNSYITFYKKSKSAKATVGVCSDPDCWVGTTLSKINFSECQFSNNLFE